MIQLSPGAEIGGYQIEALVGRGGMAEVYRARQRRPARTVALKVVAPEAAADPDFRSRFEQESLIAAEIEHPNVIPVYAIGEERKLLYIAMRFVEGVDLSRFLSDNGRLEPERAARLIAQVADALDAAHAHGLVHRDVKPHNVLVSAKDHVYLTDFGITKRLAVAAGATKTGSLVGTPDYVAPEQIEGDRVDARADVYALGCMTYQLLSDRVPFQRDSAVAKIFAHVNDPPPLLADVAPALASAVQRAMAKRPEDRFTSAGEFGQAVIAGAACGSAPAPGQTAEGHEARSRSAADLDRAPAFPPALTTELGEEAFIGRDYALTRLRERYSLADTARRQFVLLCGEPGIGKTRLASEFARDAHRQGAVVLYGRSDREALVPYQPFITAIEQYIADCGQRDLAQELDLELRELGRLIPGLRRHVPTLLEPLEVEPESRRYRMFDAVSRVLAFIASDRTAVLILDDLQWADTSTALLVRHTVQQLHGVRLLIIGTFRDSEPARSEDLAELVASRPDRGFERISLSGFDPNETGAFLVARQGRSATDRFIRQLRSGTGGNPLFMEETLKTFTEAEPVEGGDTLSERALSGIENPQRVNAVIAQRLLRLTDNTRHTLAVASVVGAEFQLGLLDIEQPADQIISALEEAEAAGLVREAKGEIDRFSFSHALVREVLREQQSESRRWRRHRRIGEKLEDIAEKSAVNPAELAYHFFESRYSDRGLKAFRYSVEAGDRAAESFAHDEAAQHYKRALTAVEMHESPDESRRCNVLLALGRVELRQGDPQARRTFEQAAALARQQGLSEHLGRAALGFASRYTEAGVVDYEGIALLREAVDQLGENSTALRAELMARLADSLHFAPEHKEALSLSHAAMVLAREVGDTHALVAALVSRHAALLHIAHLDERLRLSQELLDLAARVGERELAALGHHWRIYDLLEAAEIDAARAEHRALVELAKELRQPLYDHFSVGWDVVWANMAGRVEEAEQLAEDSLELGRQAQARDAETVYWAQVLALRRREHRLADFISTVQSAGEQLPALMAWHTALPLAHLAAGKLGEAVKEFEWLADDHFSRVPEDMFWFTSICVLAETCALIRDRTRASELYHMLLPYKDRNVQVTRAACWGSCERFLGLLANALGNWEAASDHFESAIAKNAAGGNAGAVSVVKCDYAEMLVARRANGDLGKAMDLYRDTLQAAQDADMPQLTAHILAMLEEIEGEG